MPSGKDLSVELVDKVLALRDKLTIRELMERFLISERAVKNIVHGRLPRQYVEAKKTGGVVVARKVVASTAAPPPKVAPKSRFYNPADMRAGR